MAKNGYLPRSDKEKGVWITTFATQLALVASVFNISALELTNLMNDAVFYNWMLNMLDVFTAGKENRTAFKNLMADAPLGSPMGVVPAAPVIPVPPVTVAPGIFTRVRLLVQRLKNHPNYTVAIGEQLKIIGAEEEVQDLATLLPVIKLVLHADHVEVRWRKGDADGIRIESDKGHGWEMMADDYKPHYNDPTPIPSVPTMWKYRARYIVDEVPVGQWSGVMSVAVG